MRNLLLKDLQFHLQPQITISQTMTTLNPINLLKQILQLFKSRSIFLMEKIIIFRLKEDILIIKV